MSLDNNNVILGIYIYPKTHENRTISSALQRPYGLYKCSSCLPDGCDKLLVNRT